MQEPRESKYKYSSNAYLDLRNEKQTRGQEELRILFLEQVILRSARLLAGDFGKLPI